MAFRAEVRDTLGQGNYKNVLITHLDDEGNSMRVGHIILPENLTDEFVELFK